MIILILFEIFFICLLIETLNCAWKLLSVCQEPSRDASFSKWA